LSLDTRKALPPFGRSRAGSRATAVTAAAAAASVLTACVLTACGSGPGSPPSDASPPAASASSPASASRTLSETGSSLIGTTVAWPRQPAALGAAGSDAIISSVKSAPGAIGYVGVSYLSQVMNANEGEALLGNSSGNFVIPTARAIQAALASFTNTPASETISLINGAAAQAYPIINYEYAVVNTSQSSATRAQDLRAFLTWAVTSGTAPLVKVNFQPLPPSVITLSDAQIARIKG